jgi:membrane-bound lytic murein transglycosylase F
LNTTRNWILLTLFTVLAFFAVNWLADYQVRKNTITEPTVELDLDEIKERGVLRVIMEYNSISYFIYKGQRLGFEYELIKKYADELGVKLELVMTKSSEDPYNLLNEGKGDIIANALIENSKLKQQVSLTNAYRTMEQVIVQRQSGRTVNAVDSTVKYDTLLLSAMQLSNKIVYVTENSVYYYHLKELSDSFGINMDVRILSDDRSTDDIIEAVALGDIDYTIANKDIALVNQSYFSNLDVSTKIGKAKNLHWAVRNNSPDLLESLNNWIKDLPENKYYADLYNKYFKAYKSIQSGYDEESELQQGMISKYDAIIQRHARKINWDWRMIAAIIHQESAFNPQARSWAGAQGLMQLMPGTARDVGVNGYEAYIPDKNIRGGTEYLKRLEKIWSDIPDFTQRIKFILASYNAGPGHVSDAARLAAKNGYPNDKWDGSVEYFMLYKSNPRFYNDPVVKYGYCRGQEPFNYVRRIINKYFEYQSRINLTTATQTANAFRIEQLTTQEFDGLEGIYNPTQGLIARSARRELFLSHKLFNETNELVPKHTERNPFNAPKQELFVRKEDSSAQLFKNKKELFQKPKGNYLEPKQDYELNKLQPKRK